MLRSVLISLTMIILLPVSALAQSCSFSVSSVDFGNVDTLTGAVADTTASVDVTCSSGLLTNVRVCLNIDAGSGGATSGTRHMRNAANAALDYTFYQDAARTIPWGSRTNTALGSPVALNFTQLLGSTTQSRTIYARVFANQQSAAAGLYTSIFSGAQVSFNYTTYLLITNPPACSTVTQNTTQPSFTTQANVIPNCSVTAQNINFGSHGVLSSQVDATGGINVTCTPGTNYTIGLNNGLSGTGPTARRMTLGGESVLYGLYKDSARSQPWGNAGGDLATGTGAGATQSLPVYGRVPSQPTPAAGLYTDTVVVTVTY